MIFFKHRRSAERDAFSVPHSVQKSIPIKRIYQDGVFQVSGKFSKTWRFFDVNYAVASPEKQRELFMTYCSCLLYTSPSPRDGLLSRMPSSA